MLPPQGRVLHRSGAQPRGDGAFVGTVAHGAVYCTAQALSRAAMVPSLAPSRTAAWMPAGKKIIGLKACKSIKAIEKGRGVGKIKELTRLSGINSTWIGRLKISWLPDSARGPSEGLER